MIKRYLDFIGESLEFLLESDVVYSEKFRKVISNILSPISSKLLEIENKDLPVRSNYFDILKDKNDTITFLPDRKAQEILKDKQDKLGKTINELKARYQKSQKQEDAFVFRGKQGIKSIFEDILNEKKELFCYGAESSFKEMFPFYQKHWNEERAKLKIKVKMIYNEKVKEEKKKENLKLLEMKFLPETYDFPSTIMIYSDRVITIVWLEEPFGFMIKSEEAVKSNMNFFDLLWKLAKS